MSIQSKVPGMMWHNCKNSRINGNDMVSRVVARLYTVSLRKR